MNLKKKKKKRKSHELNWIMHLINTHPYRFGPLCYTQKPYKKSHLSLQTTIYCHPTRFHKHYTAAAIQSPMEAAGTDSDGREFKNPDEMWLEHTGDINKKTQWYHDGVAYWEVSLFVCFFICVFWAPNWERWKIDESNIMGFCCFLLKVLFFWSVRVCFWGPNWKKKMEVWCRN